MASIPDIDLSDPYAPVAPPQDPHWSVADQAWVISRYGGAPAGSIRIWAR
jgi:hypothetical protein